MSNRNLDYDAFIEGKNRKHISCGFEPGEILTPLFDWQRQVVQWACRTGRAALFEDCGLGKTLQQLEWASQVVRHTGGMVLILTPLAVAAQTQREAERFGIRAHVVESQEQCTIGIYITNYEKLEHFDCSKFAGVVLDESSILKNFTGVTRRKLTAAFAETPYRLCCTATPSPNDYTEFGQHADFLGVCTPAQMLATFFLNDTFNTGDWRLKKHAEKAFWQWVSSWAACLAKPSDIGFSDDGYELPPLNLQAVVVEVDETRGAKECELFRHATFSATTMHEELRFTVENRVGMLAIMVNGSTEQWVVWCNTDQESRMLRNAIHGAVEVKGSDKASYKERAAMDFIDGKIRVLISKSRIFGMGMNFQHCHNTAFVGLSYSFEALYQSLRRLYRFGQTRQVNAYIFYASTEGPILKTIKQKIKQHEEMQMRMKQASAAFSEHETKRLTMKTDIITATGADWTLHHGDCVRVAREKIADKSIGFSVFSPPFADLFTYSADMQDMGNCKDLKEFMVHFDIWITELVRVMLPGREVAVHCVDLLSTKWKHGAIEFQDFSGEIIRAFRKHGFLNHSRITIWKSPVTEMERTKAHGLLYKTLRGDSADSRVGCPDYLLVFRAPGKNPQPVTKTRESHPLSWWQEVASPVWMTVNQGRVLNRKGAKGSDDERHICPLQLDVIERAIEMWSNPGDLVYSPFTGIGSEGYQAIEMGRKFVGSELKESYFREACGFLNSAGAQLSLAF